MSTSSTTIMVGIQTNGLISKLKAQITSKYIYIFGMCKLRGIFWYIIYANRMMLKIWTHLTFGWPFVNISLTIHPTHNKLYIFVILIASRVIWYTWKVIWRILKFWPLLDLCVTPTGKGPNRPKFCQNIFWPITTSNHQQLIFVKMALEYFFHYSLHTLPNQIAFLLLCTKVA